MRIRFPFFCRSAATLTLVALLGPPDIKASVVSTGRITEVILFSLNRPGNVDDQNVLIRAAHSLRRVKGVDHLNIGRAVPGRPEPAEQSFDVAIVLTFKNRRAWQKFERDENYRRIMDIALRPLVRRSVVYNFTSE